MSLRVGANEYDLVGSADGQGGLAILVGGIEAAGQHAAVPERVVPLLDARVPPFGVAISEANTVDGDWVRGTCSYLVQANGVTIYGRPWVASVEQALADLGWVLPRLRVHPVRWWEPSDYTDRPVWAWGVPSLVRVFSPLRGVCTVVAEGGRRYPRQGGRSIEVDILSGAVDWERR